MEVHTNTLSDLWRQDRLAKVKCYAYKDTREPGYKLRLSEVKRKLFEVSYLQVAFL